MRIIEFSDGFTSSGAPSISPLTGTATALGLGDGPTGSFIYNATTSTKTVYFDLSGATSLKKTTLTFSQTDNRVITFPDATTTLVGTDVAQTLTNKTIVGGNNTISDLSHGAEVDEPSSGVHGVTGSIVGTSDSQVLTNKDIDGGTASNTSRITIPSGTYSSISALTRKAGTILYATDTKKFYKDNGTSLSEVGAGGGSGINYIDNPDAETDASGWSAYADAASSSPADGTGGSPTVTITQSASSPLRDVDSFLITKDAADRQGEGVSYDFTIDAADKASVLNVSFDYSGSANFASGDSSDVRVWVYDVTNSSLIPVTPYTIQGGTGYNWKFTGTFQTAVDSTSYRLILHIATTNASAWTFKFDNVVVGPQYKLLGAPIGDWTSFTPTGSWSTNTTYTGQWRRVGDSMEVWVKVATSGAPDTATLTVNMPSGYTIDTAKIDAETENGCIGQVTTRDESPGTNYVGVVYYNSSSSITPCNLDSSSQQQYITETQPFTFGNTDEVHMTFKVPISGWGSTVVMSNDTDTRVVALKRTNSAGTSISSGNNVIPFATAGVDTHGGWSTDTYTVPVSGKYSVSCTLLSASTAFVAGANTFLWVQKNGSDNTLIGGMWAQSSVTMQMNANGSTILDLVAGDTIKINLISSTGFSLSSSAGANQISIQRLSGPSAIAATEKVYLQYTGNGGTTLVADTTDIDFTTKVVDSHGAWSGSVFTAPRAGFYIVEGQWLTTANAGADTELYIDGTKKIRIFADYATATNHSFKGSIYMLSGEQLSVRADGTPTLSNNAVSHWISIYSQG